MSDGKRHRRSMTVGCVLAIAAATVASTRGAWAQTRVDGGGRMLDANLSTGSRLNSSTPAIDFRARNLIVTRNVAGGRGFRGTVGYTAERDFRGAVGSDDLFRFLAESAYSAPTFIAAGRTTERLRFGEYIGVVEFRRDGGGHGSTLQGVGEQIQSSYLPPVSLTMDHVALSSGSTASVAASSQMEIIGVFKDEEGTPLIASASPLRGLRLAPLNSLPQSVGLTGYDFARTRQDVERGTPVVRIGDPFVVGFEHLNPAYRPPADPDAEPRQYVNRIDAGREPEMRRVMESVADRFAALPSDASFEEIASSRSTETLARLEIRITSLREMLQRFEAMRDANPVLEVTSGDPKADDPTGADKLSLPVILDHGQRLEHLSTTDSGRFNELVREAEKRLAVGEYFWAERHFTRALRFVPGHPLATAGLAHARIGAGLYASSALTLRRLFATRPEMIDVVYDAKLLPNRVRMNVAIRILEQELLAEGPDRPLYAFLLAYIGHQTGDAGLVRRGVDALQMVNPDDPLLPVIREAWRTGVRLD